MTFAQLKAALLADTHRENYDDATASRFVAQGEAFIRSKLRAYSLTSVLDDTDRSGPTSGIYTTPGDVIRARYLINNANGMPLDQVDENFAWNYRSNADAIVFAIRPNSVVISGVPGAGAAFTLHYLGMPSALVAAGDSNALLNDFPQLYQDAAAIYLWRRVQDYESAQLAQQSALSLIRDINARMGTLLSGARSVPVYNTNFRSAY